MNRLLQRWGFDDPKIVGASEYTAIYECLSDVLEPGESRPVEMALAVLNEFTEHAQAMRVKVIRALLKRVL